MITGANMSEARVARQGVWTPWAAVLCCDCHDKAPQADFRMGTVERLPEAGEALTFCDDCESECIVSAPVARLHNLIPALRDAGLDADMEQTGGMCWALAVESSPEGRLGAPRTFAFVTNLDGPVIVTGWASREEWIRLSEEGANVDFSSAELSESATDDDVMKAIIGAVWG